MAKKKQTKKSKKKQTKKSKKKQTKKSKKKKTVSRETTPVSLEDMGIPNLDAPLEDSVTQTPVVDIEEFCVGTKPRINSETKVIEKPQIIIEPEKGTDLAPVDEKPIPEEKPVYSFPSRSRCPRCGLLDNYATTTQGKYQSRKCRINRPPCMHGTTWVVTGKLV